LKYKNIDFKTTRILKKNLRKLGRDEKKIKGFLFSFLADWRKAEIYTGEWQRLRKIFLF
jgi:hypothetical protein